MIRYSTNWMGPVNMQWYRDRGLIKNVEHILTETSLRVKFGTHKPGDVVVYEEQTEHWSGGRIDIRGTSDPYGDELSLPIMHGEDYNNFSTWLRTVETDDIWSLAQLVEQYEKTHSKIRWAEEVFKNIDKSQ